MGSCVHDKGKSFFLPGDELLLIWHLWFDKIVPTVVIESDTMIELSRFPTAAKKFQPSCWELKVKFLMLVVSQRCVS
jgi:hypothetical protein